MAVRGDTAHVPMCPGSRAFLCGTWNRFKKITGFGQQQQQFQNPNPISSHPFSYPAACNNLFFCCLKSAKKSIVLNLCINTHVTIGNTIE